MSNQGKDDIFFLFLYESVKVLKPFEAEIWTHLGSLLIGRGCPSPQDT